MFGSIVGQLWRSLTFRFGSACAGRARDLTAGKLTPKLSYRKADIRGRQWPTRSGQSALQVDVSKADGPVRRASDFATGLAGNEVTTARRPKDSVVGHVRVCSHRYHGSQPSARVAGLLPQ